MSSEAAARKTPLHGVHVAAGARMVPFAGWEMPVQYTGVVDEHLAVRTRVGRLLEFWVQSQAAPAWYFPKTSWTAATAPAKAADAWLGGRQHVGERDYGLGYARLLAGERALRRRRAGTE